MSSRATESGPPETPTSSDSPSVIRCCCSMLLSTRSSTTSLKKRSYGSTNPAGGKRELGADFLPAVEVRLELLGNVHAAVGLLIVLQQSDIQTRQGSAASV